MPHAGILEGLTQTKITSGSIKTVIIISAHSRLDLTMIAKINRVPLILRDLKSGVSWTLENRHWIGLSISVFQVKSWHNECVLYINLQTC